MTDHLSYVQMSEELREAAVQSARTRVAALLQEPEHLGKVSELSGDISSASAALQTQLDSVVGMQLNDARSALNAASSGRACVSSGLRHVSSAGATAAQTSHLVYNYPLVSALSSTASNIRKSLDLLDAIQAIPEQVEDLNAALDEDDEALIAVHAALAELEKERDSALQRASSHPAEQASLRIHFEGVDALRGKLLKRIRQLFGRALELAASMPNLLIALLIIVVKEEEAAKAKGAVSECEYFAYSAELGRYGMLMMDALDRAAEERFMGHFGMCASLSEVLDAAAFVVDDLESVYDVVRPAFPPQFRVFEFFVAEYHARLYHKLEEMTLSSGVSLTGAEILSFISWVREYQDDMALRLGVTSLSPVLVDAFEPLMGMYLKHLSSRLSEWTHNIFLADTSDRDVDAQPERDITGLSCTAAPVHLFKMVNEQVDVAAGTSTGKFLLDVLDTCVSSLKAYQDSVAGMLVAVSEHSSLWQAPSGKDDPPDEDMAFLYAVEQINNGSICMRHTQSLRDRVSLVLDVDDDLLTLDELENGWAALANQAAGVVGALILADLEPILDSFFSSKGPGWEEADLVETVVATLEDYYLEDELKDRIDPVFFERMAIDQEIVIVQAYVAGLLRSKQTFSPEKVDRMMDDKDMLDEFFGAMLLMKAKKATRVTSVISMLGEFLCAGVGNIGLWIEDLVRENPDLGREHLVVLNNMRPGLDKKERAAELEARLRFVEGGASSGSGGGGGGGGGESEFSWFS